jgi:hypothetical protein
MVDTVISVPALRERGEDVLHWNAPPAKPACGKSTSLAPQKKH